TRSTPPPTRPSPPGTPPITTTQYEPTRTPATTTYPTPSPTRSTPPVTTTPYVTTRTPGTSPTYPTVPPTRTNPPTPPVTTTPYVTTRTPGTSPTYPTVPPTRTNPPVTTTPYGPTRTPVRTTTDPDLPPVVPDLPTNEDVQVKYIMQSDTCAATLDTMVTDNRNRRNTQLFRKAARALRTLNRINFRRAALQQLSRNVRRLNSASARYRTSCQRRTTEVRNYDQLDTAVRFFVLPRRFQELNCVTESRVRRTISTCKQF
ncbi:hypothetical protein OSTOST_11086, partial [Ostertagia ostertagi]